MSADLERLEGRLRATGLVGDVVEALWALARAQLPRAAAATAQATQYLDWVDDAVAQLAEPVAPAEGAPRLWIVIGPERSFAGSLPRRVVAQGLELAREGDRLAWVGRRTVEHAPADEPTLFWSDGVCSVDEVDERAEELAALLLEHAAAGSVIVAHPRARQDDLHTATLLAGPLRRRQGAAAPDTYSPMAVILARAVRMSVSARLRVALMEAFHAETYARVVATETARQAIDRKRTHLKLALGVYRKESITAEIAESFGSRQRHRQRRR